MNQDVTFLMALGLVLSGVVMAAIATQLPRFWKWFKWKVWYDYRYAAGYRKGLDVGLRTARRADSE